MLFLVPSRSNVKCTCGQLLDTRRHWVESVFAKESRTVPVPPILVVCARRVGVGRRRMIQKMMMMVAVLLLCVVDVVVVVPT